MIDDQRREGGSALMPRMSESEVFVGLPSVDIKSQDAALLVMLVAPRCVQGTNKPLRRGGDGPSPTYFVSYFTALGFWFTWW